MQGAHTFSVEDAYNISYKKNSHWGIEGYDIVKVYLDPSRQVKQREYLIQKKGQKNKSYVTKRGHYLEDYAKEKKGIPEPNKYNIETKWPDPKAKPQRPSSTQPKKYYFSQQRQTYIDDIINEQKRRPIPGPGKYDPIKTLELLKKEQDEMKKKHISEGERPTYLNEYEFQANYPGPGQYNPHDEIPKDKQNNTNPKYWIEKHKKVPTPVKFPCVGTYAPILDETFEKLSKEKPCQKKIWGAEDRFKDVKKSKSLVKDGPGPGQYAVTEEWLGKTTKKETQKKPLSQYITRGISKSIYY